MNFVPLSLHFFTIQTFYPMRQFFTLALLLCFFASPVWGQMRLFSAPKDTTKFNNRKYKQELGLNVAGIFGGYVGGSLVWKIRDDRSELVPVTYSNYWRIQAGTAGRTFTGYEDSIRWEAYLIRNISARPSSYNQFWATIGRERNNFHNRFNLFYGWEVGPRLEYEHSTNGISGPLVDQNGLLIGHFYGDYRAKTFSLGAYAAAFFGVKYRFSERISLSFETAFWLLYSASHRKTNTEVKGVKVEGPSQWYHKFEHSLSYIRFITLNYHFKQY